MLRLGPLLALQFALATEVFFTLTLALVLALALVAFSAPRLRRTLRALLLPLLGCYGAAFALVSPLLYYALSDFQTGAITPTNGVGADLVNFAFPSQLSLIGGGLALKDSSIGRSSPPRRRSASTSACPLCSSSRLFSGAGAARQEAASWPSASPSRYWPRSASTCACARSGSYPYPGGRLCTCRSSTT